MRKSRFTEALIFGMIKEQVAGLPTTELCRKNGLSSATFCKLKSNYGGMELSDAKRLRQLEDENAKLNRLVADVMQDNEVLKDLQRKPYRHRRSGTTRCSGP
jgi:putative transposase